MSSQYPFHCEVGRKRGTPSIVKWKGLQSPFPLTQEISARVNVNKVRRDIFKLQWSDAGENESKQNWNQEYIFIFHHMIIIWQLGVQSRSILSKWILYRLILQSCTLVCTILLYCFKSLVMYVGMYLLFTISNINAHIFLKCLP